MAKRTTRRRAEDVADFADQNADKEAIEKLAESARTANAKMAGHNSGQVSDEDLLHHSNLIEAAQLEIDQLAIEMGKKRGVLGSRKKAAKKANVDVDALMMAIKLKKRSNVGGMGAIVTEHRTVGRLLRLWDHPLGTQFSLFPTDTTEEAAAPAAKSEEAVIAEATLAGEQAGLNGEPKTNNPHREEPGTPKWFGWNNGWQIGADKLTDSFKTGKLPAPAGVAAH